VSVLRHLIRQILTIFQNGFKIFGVNFGSKRPLPVDLWTNNFAETAYVVILPYCYHLDRAQGYTLTAPLDFRHPIPMDVWMEAPRPSIMS
jgi:hypothetical protein